MGYANQWGRYPQKQQMNYLINQNLISVQDMCDSDIVLQYYNLFITVL